MSVVECRAVLFQEAKAHLLSLKEDKVEVRNAAGDLFRFTKQVMKALSDKARDKSIGRAPHWAAVAQIEKLCAESVFLWGEKPRNGSVDIERYVKHGAGFSFEGAIERNGARGITDSIPAQEQSLDPSAVSRIQNLVCAVKGSGNEEIR